MSEHKSVLKRAGVHEGVRLYDARHLQATLLRHAGVYPKIVSERVEHSTINITLDTYNHELPGMRKESARKPGAMLFQSVKGREDGAPLS